MYYYKKFRALRTFNSSIGRERYNRRKDGVAGGNSTSIGSERKDRFCSSDKAELAILKLYEQARTSQVLGGSRAINASFYSRTDQVFYRKDGINWDLRVARIGPYNGLSLDHLVGTKLGVLRLIALVGERAADFLSYTKTSNIRVTVHAIVERVLLATSLPYPPSKPSAIGVVYRDQRGEFHHAMLRDKGEVLLSAGALGSPQLLLLSGFRPSAYQSSWGIPVACHHPYVDKFVYDNSINVISIVPKMPLEHSLIQMVGITNSGAYLEAASNIIPFSAPSQGAFVRSSPFLVYFIVATLKENIVGPLSPGSLRLASTDVKVNPIVRFTYFRNPAIPWRNSSTNNGLVQEISSMLDLHCLLIYPMIFLWESSPVSLVQEVSLEPCLTLENRIFLEMKTICNYIEETPAPYLMNGQFEMPRKRFAYESPIEELDYDRSVVPIEKPLGKLC
ncbi:hypothetical protein M9H77_18945 [Catharanthus roseus]|uniref:Uncharacterized protein n=1 Tax=Catharanthus roseus TaxID=4058 RepID=A0ACC0B8W2_CATRO|nr:hypothetical protein M9H77_18945 [Catharanthus roseus]